MIRRTLFKGEIIRNSSRMAKILFSILLVALGISTALRLRPSSSTALFGKKELDEQWRIQQEMLARRRDPIAKAAQEAKVDARREEASRKVSKNFWNKRVNKDEDPLEQWKEARDRGEVKDFGYPDEPPKESSLFGLNIPIPQSPIDVPKYDNGERFDLRLPYAERGYEDEDADVMGKMAKAFGSLFGGKKAKKEE